jgi:two-component system sensor histidine kinase BaeS
LTDRQSSLVRRIQASTQHVITFALNLIDAARVDAGRLTLQRRATGVADVVEDALLLVRSASELKGVALQATIAPQVPMLSLDPVQMQRVIANLVGNAIKFTPVGGTVSLSVTCPAADAVLLEVRDTGVGIAAEHLPSIFEKHRYYNPNGSIDGSGLGLFIVNAIVKAHGGSVDISSTAGVGTVVRVRLPLRAVAGAMAERAPIPASTLVPGRELI